VVPPSGPLGDSAPLLSAGPIARIGEARRALAPTRTGATSFRAVPPDANRSRRDVRAYGWICLGVVTVAVVAATLMWNDDGRNDVSVVFLVLAALILPPYFLLRRDALRGDRESGELGFRSQVEPATVPVQPGGDKYSGQIIVSRPVGYYQDALRRYKILIDGQEAGSLKRGETLRHAVRAGRHDVVAKIDWSGSPTAHVDVRPGGTVTVKVSPGSPLGGFFSTDKWLTLSIDGN
jgi:hypothetical protein